MGEGKKKGGSVRNDRVMTTRELAKYMKLSEKTVLKKSKNGELPGVKIGSQWRFNLSAVDAYLQEDIMSNTPKDELGIIIETAQNIIPLSRLIPRDLMDLDLKAKTKNEVLSTLAETAYNGGIVTAKKTLFNQLVTREKMLSTAVGHGVAVPHPRNPEMALFKKPNILIARSKKGVEFQSPDNKKTHLFFMTCAPSTVSHLRLLAKISKLLHIKGIVDKLMRVESREEMVRLFLSVERNQLFQWEMIE